MRLFFLCLFALINLGCSAVPTKSGVSSRVENPHISEYFRLLDTYCHGQVGSKEELESYLNTDKQLIPTSGGSQTIYLSTKDGVTFGVFPEKYGCAVDFLQSLSPNPEPFTYRELYHALETRGYEMVSGISMNGLSVNRHLLSPKGENTLLFIPDLSDIDDRYISMYVENFREMEPDLFPRGSVYIRGGLPGKVKASLIESQETVPMSLLEKADKLASYKLIADVSHMLEEGRLYYLSEPYFLHLASQALLKNCYDKKLTDEFLSAVLFYRKGIKEYASLGVSRSDRERDLVEVGYLGSVAQALLVLGESRKSLFFYESLLEYFGDRFKESDPGGYVLFMEDYSAALFNVGKDSQARKVFRKIKPTRDALRGKRIKLKYYRKSNSCHVNKRSRFHVKNELGRQTFLIKNSDIVVNVEFDEVAYDLIRIGGIYDIVFSSTRGGYQLVSLEHRSVSPSSQRKVHPIMRGFEGSRFSPEKSLHIEDWKVMTSTIMGGADDGYLMTVQFILRDRDNIYQDISLVFEF